MDTSVNRRQTDTKLLCLHSKFRLGIIALLYASIPLFLYMSVCHYGFMLKIDGYIFFITVALLPFLTNKSFLMNGLHGSIFCGSAVLYSLLLGVTPGLNGDLASVLKSFVDTSIELTDSGFGEVQERAFSAIGWILVLYPLFVIFYYFLYEGVKYLRKKWQ